MKILSEHGNDDLAKVYVASFGTGKKKMVEFAESRQPPHPIEEKWVLIVSSLFGCPVKCQMCDAGGGYSGRLSSDQILAQVDHMVTRRYPDRRLPQEKFKVQFARMGEPALNPAVLDALEALPKKFDAPGLTPCVSTIAPKGSEEFFERLLAIKDRLYPCGHFQLQLSIHTTDEAARDRLISYPKWGLEEIAAFGSRWKRDGDRKVTLNFAAAKGNPIDTKKVRRIFDPETFLIKLTPVNPTKRAQEYGLVSVIDPLDPATGQALKEAFEAEGFETILSIGEVEENQIGSNCGMYLNRVA